MSLRSRPRFEAIDPDDNLHGAPERSSRSNRYPILRSIWARGRPFVLRTELYFWVVDDDKKSVTGIHQDGSVIVYRMRDTIPLAAFGSDELPVARIFA